MSEAMKDPTAQVHADDLSLELGVLADVIHDTKVRNDWTITTPAAWEDENRIPADLASIHSEVSEALEAFRNNDKANFAEELGDVMIRVVGLARGLEINLAQESWKKAVTNRDRAYRHGGKRL